MGFFLNKNKRRCKIVTHKPKKTRDNKKIASRITIIALLLLSSKLGFDKYQLGNKLAKLEEDSRLASNKTNCQGEQIATEVGEVDIWDFPEDTTQKDSEVTQKVTADGNAGDNDLIIDDFDIIDYFPKNDDNSKVEEIKNDEIVTPTHPPEVEEELENNVNTPTPSVNDDDKETSYPDSVVNDDILTPSVDPDLEYDPEAAEVKATINIRRKW